MMMAGKLYGVGVGPGDPELMTLKAVRLIKECDFVAVPKSGEGEGVAKQIARRAVGEEIFDQKQLVEVAMPMTRDPQLLEESHRQAVEQIEALLDGDKTVVFLTLGDPAIYSTYIYVHKRVQQHGYAVEMVPGVPSFCAVAAKLNISLAEGAQPLHVIPASYQGVEEGLEWAGPKVLMKTGRSMKKVKHLLQQRGALDKAQMIQKCGMEGEQIYRSMREVDEDASYFSVVIVKEQEREDMVYFVGAGSGAVDLITVRGQRLLRQADVVIYAGSLVNPQLLKETRPDCRLYNSAKMTLEEVLEVIEQAHREQACIVRLHTGDPCLYGAIREQMDQLDALNIPYEYVPGVSSFCAAAAALNAEYTLPDVSQTVIITRMAGRTPVPEKEEIAKLAAHQATMVIFLSTGLLEGLQQRLMEGGYPADTPAAIVYKASWPDEKTFRCTVSTLAQTAKENNITKTALILVGRFLDSSYERSKLYDPSFETEFRKATR